jgi:protocatechuate 3,4-dioxygenase alpha subunit
MSEVTPSQTVGPYFAYGLTPRGAYAWSDLCANDLVTPDAAGERIRIEGQVTDAKGVEINDAMIEIWQADAQGRYAHPRDTRALPNSSFRGFGRIGTDSKGFFFFDTIKPGPVPGPNGEMQAPHVLVAFYARGLLTHLYTRIYLEGEAANASDPILSLVPGDRRGTLIARRETRGEQPVYRFDIRFQPDGETVFFDV